MAKVIKIKAVEDFQKGMRSRNVQLVKQALNAGVSPLTPVDGFHPLEVILYANYKQFVKAVRAGKLDTAIPPEETFCAQGARILDLLLQTGEIDLLAKTQYGDLLVDRLLLGEYVPDVVKVVMHAIVQSLEDGGEVYQPDMVRIINNTLRSMDVAASATHATNVFSFLKEVHDEVRFCLMNPKERIEWDIIENYDAETISYWMKDLDMPEFSYAKGGLSQPGAGSGKSDPGNKSLSDPYAKAAAKTEEDVSQHVKLLPKKTPGQVMAELNGLIGMETVKKEAQSFIYRAQWEAARGVFGSSALKQSLHTAFVGNPGTGKTITARLRAELFHSLGLTGNRYIEISRENMVGQFIGQTEAKMVEIFKQADVIFIDEAYNLVDDSSDNKDFGKRVIDALMIALENNQNLTVMFAGYPVEMEKFLSSNPGLKSRVPHTISMPDYSLEELGRIMDLNLKKAELTIATDARMHAIEQLAAIKEASGERNFGNARVVRSLVEQLPNKMAERLFGQAAAEVTSAIVTVPGQQDLSTVVKDDVEALGLVKKFRAAPKPFQMGFEIGIKAGRG